MLRYMCGGGALARKLGLDEVMKVMKDSHTALVALEEERTVLR
jgi:hypothetical protein